MGAFSAIQPRQIDPRPFTHLDIYFSVPYMPQWLTCASHRSTRRDLLASHKRNYHEKFCNLSLYQMIECDFLIILSLDKCLRKSRSILIYSMFSFLNSLVVRDSKQEESQVCIGT